MLLKRIPIEYIRVNENNTNIMDQRDLDRLSKSIEKHGFIVPIIVVKKGDFYHLVDGEHRLRVFKGNEIPAIVLENINEKELKLLPTILNDIRGYINEDKLLELIKNDTDIKPEDLMMEAYEFEKLLKLYDNEITNNVESKDKPQTYHEKIKLELVLELKVMEIIDDLAFRKNKTKSQIVEDIIKEYLKGKGYELD